MARTRKSILPLNLYKYDVLIEDNRTRSEYFKVTQFDGFLHGGRNGFLLAGASTLRPGSKILVEILNKNGTTVYSAPVSSFVEGNSRLIQVEVYEDTPIGPGKIVMLGCADTYLDGTPVPPEWQGKYNVRWIADVVISPRIENKSPIRFPVTPSMVATEKYYPSPATASFSESISLPFDITISPKYYNVFQNGYQIKVNGVDNAVFKSDYIGGLITGSIYFTSASVAETASIRLPLTKIFNNTSAESVGSLIYTDKSKTLLVGGYLSSSGEYTTNIAPFGDIGVTSSISLLYNRLATVETGSTYSYANIRITDVETISGEVHQIRLSYKPITDPGDYVTLANIPVRVQELLAIDSSSKVVELGKFTQIDIPTYWYAATMSLEKNDLNPTLPPCYNSCSIATDLDIVQSSDDLLDAIHVNAPISASTYQSASYFIGTTTSASVSLFPRTEYTLAFDAFVSRTSASVELIQSDYSVEVYLVPQENTTTKLLTDNARGQLIGVLTPTDTFRKQNFGTVQINFTPEIIQSGHFGLRFIVYGGFWDIANISVKPAEEPFFSPDEVDLLVPMLDYANSVMSFRAEFLDVNNNSAGIVVESLPTYFTGSGGRSGGGESYLWKLKDVDVATRINNDALIYDSATQTWINSQIVPSASIGLVAKAVDVVGGSIGDYATKYTGSFTGSFTGSVLLTYALEKCTVIGSTAGGTVDFDALNQSVLYYTGDATGDWTLNVRGNSGTPLNDVVGIGQTVTFIFLATNGATPYYATAHSIDGSSITPKWQGGTAPSVGNANSIDAYSYSVIKTANATFTMLASLARFA